MKRSRIVLFAALFFILSSLFLPMSRANTQGVSPELQEAFTRLGSLGNDMTKISDRLDPWLNTGRLPQNWDDSEVGAFYDTLDDVVIDINALNDEIQVTLSAIKDGLQASALPQEAQDRYHAFVAGYENKRLKLNELYDTLSLLHINVLPSPGGAPVRWNLLEDNKTARLDIESNLNELSQLFGKKGIAPVNNDAPSGMAISGDVRVVNDPDRTNSRPKLSQNIQLEKIAPKTGGTYEPAYRLNRKKASGALIVAAPQAAAGPNAAAPVSADLVQTIDTAPIPAITQLAATLGNDPIKIYEWVKNNIVYEPYYGSVKGAEKTYYDRAGNDFDTASLLISLYRESGIPSRYVYGTARLTSEQVQNMFGADSAVLSALAMSKRGIPAEWWGIFFQVERCWVEAYVPYDNYRGTVGKPGGEAWIPLDPSFKEYSYTEGLRVADSAIPDWTTFWKDFFENGVTKETSVDIFKKKLADYLAITDPSKTLTDIPITRTIVTENLDALPLSLPYAVESIHDGYAEIPTTSRHKIRYKLYDSDGISITTPTSLDVTLDIPAIISKRVTIQWVGATVADQNTIDSFGGLFSTPAFMVKVKPVLLVDGVVKGEGDVTPVDPDKVLYLGGRTVYPDNRTFGFQNATLRMNVGDIVGIGNSFNGHSAEYMQKIYDDLYNNSATLDYDEFFGQLAHLNISFYYHSDFYSSKAIYDLNHVDNYEAIANFGACIIKNSNNTLLGATQEITPSNYTFSVMGYVALSNLHNDEIDANIDKVTGATASQLEAISFERLYGTPGVSAITLIQYAYEQGIPVENGWTDADPATESVYIGTQAAPVDVQYHSWYGSGSIQTGSWGTYYLIDPGIYGGATAESFVATFPVSPIYKRSGQTATYVTGRLFPFTPASCGMYVITGDYVDDSVPALQREMEGDLFEEMPIPDPPATCDTTQGGQGCWKLPATRLTEVDGTVEYPFGDVVELSSTRYTNVRYKVGSRPDTTDYLLSGDVNHPFALGQRIMRDMYRPDVVLDFVPPAGDGEDLFGYTDPLTEDRTPDSDGNVFVSENMFTSGWSFKTVGGSATRTIHQIAKDGELLLDENNLPITDIDVIKSMGKGIYEIYYEITSGPESGTIKSLFIYVGSLVNETDSISKTRHLCATCSWVGPVREQVLFKTNPIADYPYVIKKIDWTITVTDKDGAIIEPPFTYGTLPSGTDFFPGTPTAPGPPPVPAIPDKFTTYGGAGLEVSWHVAPAILEGVYHYTITADITHVEPISPPPQTPTIPNLTGSLKDYTYIIGDFTGVFGNNRFESYDTKLNIYKDQTTNTNTLFISLRTPGRGIVVFKPDSSGVDFTPLDPDIKLSLVHNASRYELKTVPDSGTIYFYDETFTATPAIAGKIDRIEDENKNITTFGYTNGTSGYLNKISLTNIDQPEINRDIVTFDNPSGIVTRIVVPNDTAASKRETNLTYVNGNLKTVNNPDGTTVTYNYDNDSANNIADGSILSSIGCCGKDEMTYGYDNNGLFYKYTEGTGTEAVTSYGGNGATTRESTKTVDGNTTTTTYDKDGNTIRIEHPDGTYESFEYDGPNLIRARGRSGAITSYTYDSNDNVNKIIGHNGKATRYVYSDDGLNNMLSVEDSFGNKKSYTYWAGTRRMKTATNDKTAEVTEYLDYAANGRLKKYKLPSGEEITYTPAYTDGIITNMVTSSTFSGTSTTTYNSFGEVLTTTDQLGNLTTNDYDPVTGRLVSTTYRDATNLIDRITSYTYNIDGSVDYVTAPNGVITKYDYDSLGRTKSESRDHDPANLIDPLAGSATQYTYDAAGNIVATTDPSGAAPYTYTYAQGRLDSTTDFDGMLTSYAYEYDPTDNTLISMTVTKNNPSATPPATNTTTYTYDPMGRTTKVTYNDGATTTTEEFVYNPSSGLLASAKNQHGEYTYTYYSDGRLKSVHDSFTGKNITTGYDVKLRPASITYPTGRKIEYAYDTRDRRNRIFEDNAGTPLDYLTKNFDPQSRLTDITYGNGIQTTYGLNSISELETQTTLPQINDFSYDYDIMSRKTSLTDTMNDRDIGWGYDGLGRVTTTQVAGVNAGAETGTTTYAYDANGNRDLQTTERSNNPGTIRNTNDYDYDTVRTNIINSLLYDLKKAPKTGEESHAGRYYLDAEDHDDDSATATQNGALTFTHDAYGNMLTETGSVSGTTTYEYNAKNELAKVTMPDGSTAEYKYDVYGKRIERKVTDPAGAITLWKRYVYFDEDILTEYDVAADGATLSVAAEYVHDRGMDNVVAMIRYKNGVQSTYYYHKDALGSVTEITDSTGAVVKSYTYKTFGVIATVTGEPDAPPNSYTYTGREYDEETGLYYYRARYYNPMLGRFINKDPIGISGGLNMYVYVGNDPVNMIDPTGLREWKVRIQYVGIGNFDVKIGAGGAMYDKTVTFYGECSGFGDRPTLIIYEVSGWNLGLGAGGTLFADLDTTIDVEGQGEYGGLPNFTGEHDIGSILSIDAPCGGASAFSWDENTSKDKYISSEREGPSAYGGIQASLGVSLITFGSETWVLKYNGIGFCGSKGGVPREKE